MAESKEVIANKARILENKKKLFSVDHAITANAANFHLTRATIQENRDLISRNYDATFHGNFTLALGNLESIYRNRITYIRNLKAEGQVQTNFRDASINQARLALLDVRSKTNARIVRISSRMAAINTMLLELNSDIMHINSDLVEHNSAEIAANATMFASATSPALAAATPESNAAIIAANAAKLTELHARAEANAKANDEVRETAHANRAKIEANTKAIYERRALIQRNMDLITANTNKLLGTFN